MSFYHNIPMGMRLVGGFPDPFVVEATVTAGTAIAEGDALDISGNVLQRATSSSTIHTVIGVAAETISTTATKIKVIPFIQGQFWEVDAQNNTASTQLYESMVFQDHTKINNTDSDVTGPTGVFLSWGAVGAAADKKMLGEFTRLQSTST
jgi:hypothetical protein